MHDSHNTGAMVSDSTGPKVPARRIVRLSHGRGIDSSAIVDLDYAIWRGETRKFLAGLPKEPLFDLVVTSPPYNLGKSYETRKDLEIYLQEQGKIIKEIVPRIKYGGSVCWQVGNFVVGNDVYPLDIEFAPVFRELGLNLRNRIIWHFGHGLHNKRRFSGRYEVVLWFTKTDKEHPLYTFNLDPVRIRPKYPGKRSFKGPNAGKLSSNPLGKNPSDVWDIPNVKANHVEKTEHPCQFPVGLVERLVLALSNPGDLIFDPYAGVASAGVAAALHHRKFWGCELNSGYVKTGLKRVQEALDGNAVYRPYDRPVYDHTKSALSRMPLEDKEGGSE